MLENKDGKCVLGGGVYTYNLRPEFKPGESGKALFGILPSLLRESKIPSR